PASDAQLTEPHGEKPYWVDIVEDEKPPLGPDERYGAPVLTIRENDVLRTWPVETIPPPAEVTPRQMRAALRQLGLFETVDGAIQASGDTDLIDSWEYSIGFERGHPFVQGLAQTLGKTEEDLDNLFRLAGSI